MIVWRGLCFRVPSTQAPPLRTRGVSFMYRAGFSVVVGETDEEAADVGNGYYSRVDINCSSRYANSCSSWLKPI